MSTTHRRVRRTTFIAAAVSTTAVLFLGAACGSEQGADQRTDRDTPAQAPAQEPPSPDATHRHTTGGHPTTGGHRPQPQHAPVSADKAERDGAARAARTHPVTAPSGREVDIP